MTSLYLKKIALRQFRSFATLDIDIPAEPGVLIVHGSNGLGKSSLFDALEWTLSDRIDHFREANGVKKPGTYLCRWRDEAGPTSASLTFSDENVIERSLASAKATKSKLGGTVNDIIAFLKAPDWQQNISELQNYLLLTHFLGQSTISRLTYRKSTERFDILKEAAQSTAVEAIASSLYGQGTTIAARAYGKRIDMLTRDATTLTDMLAQEAALWEQSRLAGAIDQAGAAVEVRRIIDQLEHVALSASGAADDGVVTKEATVERAQTVADQVGLGCAVAEARLDDARRIYNELQRAEGRASEISGALNYIAARRAELDAAIAPAQVLRTERAAFLNLRQKEVAEAANAVGRLKGLSDAHTARLKSETDYSASIVVVETRKNSKQTAETNLSNAERKRQILSRLSAEVRLLDEEVKSLRDLNTTFDQALEAEGRVEVLARELAEREAALPNVEDRLQRAEEELAIDAANLEVQRALVANTRLTVDAMSAAISSVAKHLPADACDCPVCATHFEDASDLRDRVSTAAQRLAPTLVALEATLGRVEQSHVSSASAVQTLKTGLSSIRQNAGALAMAKDAHAALLERLDDGQGDETEPLTVRRERVIARLDYVISRRRRKVRWQRHPGLTSQTSQGEVSNLIRIRDAAQRDLDTALRTSAGGASAQERAKADEVSARALIEGGDQLTAETLNAALEQAEDSLRRLQSVAEQATEALAQADRALVTLHSELDGLKARLAQLNADMEEIEGSKAQLLLDWLSLVHFGDRPALDPIQAVEQRVLVARRAVTAALADIARLREGRLAWERQRTHRAALDQIRGQIDGPPSWTRNEIRAGALALHDQKRAQAKAVEQTREIAKAASADISAELENFNAEYIKPLGFLMKRINQAILCDPRIGIDFHVKKNKIEQSAVKEGDVPKAVGDVDPMLVHSEGQMAALAVSMLCAASLTFPWSRWKALILDDPLQHNDSIHAAAFADLIANLVNGKGYQVLLTTHDIAQAEFLQRKVRSRRIPCTTLNLLGLGKEGVEWDVQPAYSSNARMASA